MIEAASGARIVTRVPQDTIDWLMERDNPAVAVLTRRKLLGMADDEATASLWSSRNAYPPVAAILDAMRKDGSWGVPSHDYLKYRGSLWQIHLLGELHAAGTDPRVLRGVEYARSRQLPDGSWSASNMQPNASISCLTANVARALAGLVGPEDPSVLRALGYCVRLFGELGCVDCREGRLYQLNGYCHMLTPKLLLLLSAVPESFWPNGSRELRDECVAQLRDKRIFRCLPVESREFSDRLWSMPASERHGFRERFLEEHPELHYKEKAGWLRFGFPLSYNSDALEAMSALAAVGESRRPEYEDALALIEDAADEDVRWTLRHSFNSKFFADIERKGEPSKWLTLRALLVLDHFSRR